MYTLRVYYIHPLQRVCIRIIHARQYIVGYIIITSRFDLTIGFGGQEESKGKKKVKQKKMNAHIYYMYILSVYTIVCRARYVFRMANFRCFICTRFFQRRCSDTIDRVIGINKYCIFYLSVSPGNVLPSLQSPSSPSLHLKMSLHSL